MSYNFASASTQYLSSSAPSISTYPSTLSCWLYPPLSTMTMISWHYWTSSSAYSIIRLLQISTGTIRNGVLYNVGSTTIALDTTTTYTANTWVHACVVLSSSTSRTVYLNGGSSATSTANVALTGMNTVNIGRTLQPATGAGVQYYNGKISDVAIWSAALSSGEINSLAKGFSAKKIRPQSLEYYVPLVRNLNEYNGGLTITNNNAATVDNHQRIYL